MAYYYIVNKQNKVIALNSEEESQKWLRKKDFRPATQKEITAYVDRISGYLRRKNEAEQKQQKKIKKEEKKDEKMSIYLATVSQQGTDGYSNASRNIFKLLRQKNISVDMYPDDQQIGLLFHSPYSVVNLMNDYLVIYTMFESDKIPDEWVYYLSLADLVIVPSRWCQQVFAKAGVESVVVPLGYDDAVYQPIIRENKQENAKPFTFLHYNAFNVRKGFLEVYKAFTEEFDPLEPVRLLLKTTLDRAPIPITRQKYPHIDIIFGAAQNDDMRNIMSSADAFVFPSRGEGFGIPPLEAMATGLPVIVPNAHGISEYFNQQYMYEVEVESKVPALYSKYKGVDVGEMIRCDIRDLRRKMRYIYEHQEEARNVGKQAADYVKQYTYEHTINKLLATLAELIKKPPKKRSIKNVLEFEKF